MKISEQWLRSFIPSLALETTALCDKLTSIGLEVDTCEPVAKPFTDVIVAKIISLAPHTNAEHLQICSVAISAEKSYTVVSAATNLLIGMKVPFAIPGATLPDNKIIATSEFKGIQSEGMLCSAAELSLSEASDGIMRLNDDAPLGQSVWDYLQLTDHTIDIGLTPNRGDCLSALGLARDLAAAVKQPLLFDTNFSAPSDTNETISVNIEAPKDCPRYIARVISAVDITAPTPDWMQERLRRAGIRCINCIVDVTNYVALELGQPMHAFDKAEIDGGICVRRAKNNEALVLLDERSVTLNPTVLLICDHQKPLAMAGIMGGIHSGINDKTKNVVLESAFFNPLSIAGRARSFGIATDSSQRFERGVDSAITRLAIARATVLIQQIAGGLAGEIIEHCSENDLPPIKSILLRHQRVEHVLGIAVKNEVIMDYLSRLNMHLVKQGDDFLVTPPSYRFDIAIEEDLIEELARLIGFEQIPARAPKAQFMLPEKSETDIPTHRFSTLLADLGYQEVITYTFVDPKIQQCIAPLQSPMTLINPISSDMSAMRTTLWSGLLQTIAYNQNRQQARMKLFETGLRFIFADTVELQEPMLAGAIMGTVSPEQWGIANRALDFYDLKGDVEALLALTGRKKAFRFVEINTLEHTHFFATQALHPGQAAAIIDESNRELLGIIGALHPKVAQQLDINAPVFLFELTLAGVQQSVLPQAKPLSKFPAIRRDLAVIVDDALPVAQLGDIVQKELGELLQFVQYFDIYRGVGIEPGKKSVALAMILQHPTRTLVDDEVNVLIQKVIHALATQCQAMIRG